MELNKWYVVEYRQGENVWYKVERVVKFLWWVYKYECGCGKTYECVEEAKKEKARLNNLKNTVRFKVLEE